MIGGILRVDSNLVPTNVTAGGAPTSYGSTDAWMLFGMFTHYWAKEWKSTIYADYMRILPPTANPSGVAAGLNTQVGNLTTWSLGGNLIWSPVSQLDIGVEVLWGQVRQSIQNPSATYVAAGMPGLNGNNWTTQFRVQRTF